MGRILRIRTKQPPTDAWVGKRLLGPCVLISTALRSAGCPQRFPLWRRPLCIHSRKSSGTKAGPCLCRSPPFRAETGSVPHGSTRAHGPRHQEGPTGQFKPFSRICPPKRGQLPRVGVPGNAVSCCKLARARTCQYSSWQLKGQSWHLRTPAFASSFASCPLPNCCPLMQSPHA